MKQGRLFADDPGPILGVAYGLGVDSTALLIGLYLLAIRPDFILFADVGSEKAATYAYLPVIQDWLKRHLFPPVTVVKYVPKFAPYRTIEGNLTMNATLPGATFGRASCTLKWKIVPQNAWTAKSSVCQAAWANGRRIGKMIGFEAGEEHRRQRAAGKAHIQQSSQFTYDYPLMTWGRDRAECKAKIKEAGLPVPMKSACVFCPNCKPEELADLTPDERGRIVRMEVRAEPFNKKVHGLWRRPRKSDGRPGSITKHLIARRIPFTRPEDLPDKMPLNPKCAKGRRGWTFTPPHDAPRLKEMLDRYEDDAHLALASNL